VMGLQQPPSFQPGDLLPQLRCSPAPAGSFNQTKSVTEFTISNLGHQCRQSVHDSSPNRWAGPSNPVQGTDEPGSSPRCPRPGAVRVSSRSTGSQPRRTQCLRTATAQNHGSAADYPSRASFRRETRLRIDALFRIHPSLTRRLYPAPLLSMRSWEFVPRPRSRRAGGFPGSHGPGYRHIMAVND
jgi:hypothetical protein